ncbi:hypothetical protein GA0061103_6448 [Rhizobium multihospitium]|uniref:Uncharacterized protein n=1 Tax=Rhizobium multihospitium TaxID=410764 RepID=A0A1C3WWG1_9HYPH|nr:hypothetical protein GA0061103_6448 [Rhizobium multihospitium]
MVKWTITIARKNEAGDVCRQEVRIDKSWEHPFDGEVGFSVEEDKKIMAALQSAVVNHEAETYSLFVDCPDCHTFQPWCDHRRRKALPSRISPRYDACRVGGKFACWQADGQETAMRRSLHGANMLMQVRTAALSGELGNRLQAPFRQPEQNVPLIFKPRPPLLRAV